MAPSISCEIALKWIRQGIIADYSAYIPIMAWYRSAITWTNVDHDVGHNESTIGQPKHVKDKNQFLPIGSYVMFLYVIIFSVMKFNDYCFYYIIFTSSFIEQ